MLLSDETAVRPSRDSASLPSGTYRNPILFEDWPDPDVIRVGDDYYLIASSFQRSPGLPVLHSRDLVTWELIAHALPRVAPDGYGALPRHGAGVWAPSIRHHDGEFHIVYPDPDRGIFVTSATDPAGPWSPPRQLLDGLGLIDPCPLWASDGSTWLVHGWARSRAGMKNRLTMVPVDAGLNRATGPGTVVVDAEELDDWGTLEGPKLYEHDGWYWIFAPAGGVATGFQAVLRSRDPLGPYEPRVVLAQGDSPVNGPHQGAWVDTPDGTDWFLHFSDADAFGRVLHLQPMTWRDGWPVMGDPVPGETWGQPVLEHPTPHGTDAGAPSLLTGDDFTGPLDARWRWQADAGPWAQSGSGTLEVTGPPSDTGNLRTVPSVLGQPLPGTGASLTTTVRLTGPTAARAGLGVLGRAYGWVGLVRTGSGCDLVAATRGEDDYDERRVVVAQDTDAAVEIAVEVDAAGDVRLRARLAGEWRDVADPFPATRGAWVGAELVLFATAPLGGRPACGSFGPVQATVGGRTVPARRASVQDGRVGLSAGADGPTVLTLDDGRRLRTVDARRPYAYPVRTLGGVQVTQVAPSDHLHHAGVSVAPADVDGTSFWGGRTYVRDRGSTLLANHGRQQVLTSSVEGGAWTGQVAWLDPEGRELGLEERRIEAVPDPVGWILRWRTVLTPHRPLTFGSPATNGRPGAFYGGWFWRTPFRQAQVEVADGAGEAVAHGAASPWLALSDGRASLVAVQHGTVRPWFVRTQEYAGFGPALAVDERLEVTPRRPLEIAVDVLVADGPLAPGLAAAVAGRLLG